MTLKPTDLTFSIPQESVKFSKISETLSNLPLTHLEVDEVLSPLINPCTGAVAVAVSGGSHSLATAWLTQRWCQPRGLVCYGVGVNHGLRPEAEGELRYAASTLLSWGLPMAILRWSDPPLLQGNLQAKARLARYTLLTHWCHQNGITTLITGHHEDDQLETTLMRWHHNSSPYGCAGMSKRSWRKDCMLLRPFLDFPGSRLQATLKAQNVSWCEDPSNDDLGFERVRWRRVIATLTPDQRQAWHNNLTLFRHQRHSDDRACHHFLSHYITYLPCGAARITGEAFEALPLDQRHRILHAVIVRVRGGLYRPVDASYKRFLTSPQRTTTLGGCLIQRHKGVWQVSREWTTLSPQLYPAGEVLWDDRWLCRLVHPGLIEPRGGFLYDPLSSCPRVSPAPSSLPFLAVPTSSPLLSAELKSPPALLIPLR